ncbi:MAG: hypothetical protein H0U75_09745 [Legionella sp.]|nr:hypothetical protein [Legionella sp.]
MSNEIIQSAYHSDPFEEEQKRGASQRIKNPLLIGCSGGGGHNSAILGLFHYFQTLVPSCTQLQKYDPLLPSNRTNSDLRDKITRGVNLMHSAYFGCPIKWFISSVTPFPILPTQQEIKNEVSALTKTEPRVYIDILLDVYPAGYESAAIWNSLQKNDKVAELKKLIHLQTMSDKENYFTVFTYFLKKLKLAAREGKPYTELVSTQAMALPALCDVVNYYNIWLKYKNVNAPKLIIHQYMTDLPTEGAQHFFNPLSQLNQMQQSQMKLYGVGMTNEILQKVIGTHHFSAVCDIPPKENPMARPAFKEAAYDNSSSFSKTVTLDFQGMQSYTIEPNENIAAIMLGSQGSNDTSKYLAPLLQNNTNRVFVFGGTNELIKTDIAAIIKTHPEFKDRIIPLCNQDDKAISSLMTRCNTLIIRGGGLSVMEQMAMNHNNKQTVLIHHAEPTAGHELTSGIPWEDANVDALIHYLNNIQTVNTSSSSSSTKDGAIENRRYLEENGIFCQKTSPERVRQQLEKIKLFQEKNQPPQAEYKEINIPINNYFFTNNTSDKISEGMHVLQEEPALVQ